VKYPKNRNKNKNGYVTFSLFSPSFPPKNNNSKKFYYKKNTPLVGFALGEIKDWGEF
jgi:hypothetical protein